METASHGNSEVCFPDDLSVPTRLYFGFALPSAGPFESSPLMIASPRDIACAARNCGILSRSRFELPMSYVVEKGALASAVIASKTFTGVLNRRRLNLFLAVFTILIVAMLCLIYRHTVDPDSICYLDIGDQISHGHLRAAVTGYWSPLYPAIQGVILRAVHPSAYWEDTVAHGTNVMLYGLALASFLFFGREVLTGLAQSGSALPDEIYIPCVLLGHSLFLWGVVFLIPVGFLGADVCVAAVVFFVAGLLVRIGQARASWGSYALLGIMLGVGYLSKAIMFPLSFVFLVTAFFATRNWRKAIPRVLFATLLFGALSAPWFVAVSKSKGRLTFGSSGTLTYAVIVNGAVRDSDFAGVHRPAGAQLLHPTRQVFANPPVYEFASPVLGTYPVSYDLSYWLEGLRATFNVKQQLRATLKNIYAEFSFRGQLGWVGVLLVLTIAGGKWRSALRGAAQQWYLLVPSGAAIAAYALVLTESRYVAPFLVLIWAALLAGILRTRPVSLASILRPVALAVVIITMGSAVMETLKSAWLLSNVEHTQWRIAQELTSHGVHEHDRVGSIGRSFDCYWARLAHLQIIAEIPVPESYDFWLMGSSDQEQALEAFAATGAKAVVASKPSAPPGPGWVRLGSTDFYMYSLAGLGVRRPGPS